MDSAVAVSEPREAVESVYRADAERLWGAVCAFAGHAELASDAVAEAFAQVLNRDAAARECGFSPRLATALVIELFGEWHAGARCDLPPAATPLNG